MSDYETADWEINKLVALIERFLGTYTDVLYV
jgi:hypothetical protein